VVPVRQIFVQTNLERKQNSRPEIRLKLPSRKASDDRGQKPTTPDLSPSAGKDVHFRARMSKLRREKG